MDLRTLADLGEFVSGVAVVVSLAYLALQVRQNTRSLRTENYGRALERVSALQSRLGEDRELTTLVNRGLIDPEGLDGHERARFSWVFYEMFGAFEFMAHQAQGGALAPEVWRRWEGTLAWWLSFPGVSRWWRARPTPFSDSFTELVDRLLAGGSHDREAAARWRRFVRDGRDPSGSGAGAADDAGARP